MLGLQIPTTVRKCLYPVRRGSQNPIELNKSYNKEDKVHDTKETSFAHELRHAYDADMGNYKGENVGSKSGYDKPWEQRAVGFENRIRKAMGLTLRMTYGGKPIKPYPYAR